MAAPPSDRPIFDLASRLVSALVLVAIALLAVFAGPIGFDIFMAAIGIVLAWEWTRLCGEGRFGATGLTLAACVLGIVLAVAAGRPGLALAVAAGSSLAVYAVARRGARAHPGWLAAGPLYIGLPSIAMIWLRGDTQAGQEMILWLLVTVWATDSGAYFAGRLIGGPRLAPRVSPNKTWAGLIGAVISAGIVGIVASKVSPNAPEAVWLVVAGAVLAVAAQAGDLGESWVKRRFGVKDTSQLIPGHGGLFDRVDGLLAAATVLALWQWLTGSNVLSWR